MTVTNQFCSYYLCAMIETHDTEVNIEWTLIQKGKIF